MRSVVPSRRAGLQPCREGLLRLVGPAEAEAVALALEGGAPHRRLRERRTPLRAVEGRTLGEHAVDLGLHRGRDLAAADGAGSTGRLGGRRDLAAVVLPAVGEERDGAEGEREGRGGDGHGVAPERARGVLVGDAVGDLAEGRAGKCRHGEDLRSETDGRLTVLSGPRSRKSHSCPITGDVSGALAERSDAGAVTRTPTGRERRAAERTARTTTPCAWAVRRRRDVERMTRLELATSTVGRASRSARRPGDRRGADDETRTRDIDLGKVALYQLSYIRSAVRGRRARCY